MKKLTRRTRINFEFSVSEEGGGAKLEVESHTPEVAEKLFKKLYKKYCKIDSYKSQIPGYR